MTTSRGTAQSLGDDTCDGHKVDAASERGQHTANARNYRPCRGVCGGVCSRRESAIWKYLSIFGSELILISVLEGKNCVTQHNVFSTQTFSKCHIQNIHKKSPR